MDVSGDVNATCGNGVSVDIHVSLSSADLDGVVNRPSSAMMFGGDVEIGMISYGESDCQSSIGAITPQAKGAATAQVDFSCPTSCMKKRDFKKA